MDKTKATQDAEFQYPIHYHVQKEATEQEIKEIMKKQRQGQATSYDKYNFKAYDFYNTYIKNVFAKNEDVHHEWSTYKDRADTLGLAKPRDAFENDLYALYLTEPAIKETIKNIFMEVNKVPHHIITSVNKVQKCKQRALCVKYIKEICDILNLKNSFDTTTAIRDDDLNRFKDYYLSDERVELLKNLFKIRYRGSKEAFKFRHAITALTAIFRAWSGFIIDVRESNNKVAIGLRKVKNFGYVCYLTCANPLVADYVKML